MGERLARRIAEQLKGTRHENRYQAPAARARPAAARITPREGSAGLDLLAAVDEPIELLPGQRTAVPCGIAIALPAGFEAQVRPRSGLALNHGITVLNAPGTIDSDYRGEVKVILINHGDERFGSRAA